MTMPNGADGVNPDASYGVSGTGISGLANRTRDQITTELRDTYYPSSTVPSWDGLTVKPSVTSGFDASKITSGVFADGMVPSVGALRDAIYQGYNGGSSTGNTAAQVKAIFVDIASRLDDYESRISALEGP